MFNLSQNIYFKFALVSCGAGDPCLFLKDRGNMDPGSWVNVFSPLFADAGRDVPGCPTGHQHVQIPGGVGYLHG